MKNKQIYILDIYTEYVIRINKKSIRVMYTTYDGWRNTDTWTKITWKQNNPELVSSIFTTELQ